MLRPRKALASRTIAKVCLPCGIICNAEPTIYASLGQRYSDFTSSGIVIAVAARRKIDINALKRAVNVNAINQPSEEYGM